MREDFGNPSSAHPAGAAARRRLETARAQVLAAIGDAGDLTWAAGGTESDALGLLGAAAARAGGAVVVTALEHDAVLRSAERLGVPLTIAPADARGVVDLDRLLAAVTPDTAVVALM